MLIPRLWALSLALKARPYGQPLTRLHKPLRFSVGSVMGLNREPRNINMGPLIITCNFGGLHIINYSKKRPYSTIAQLCTWPRRSHSSCEPSHAQRPNRGIYAGVRPFLLQHQEDVPSSTLANGHRCILLTSRCLK